MPFSECLGVFLLLRKRGVKLLGLLGRYLPVCQRGCAFIFPPQYARVPVVLPNLFSFFHFIKILTLFHMYPTLLSLPSLATPVNVQDGSL